MRKIWIFLIILFVFVYFIFPYDFIPDFFGLFGRIDDISLLGWLMWFLRRQLFGNRQNFQGFYKQYRSDGFNTRQQYGDRNQYNRNNNNQQDSSHYERKKKSGSDRESSQSHDPYVILNVRRGATKDEIKKAYKEMIKKYHPDKVAYLGEEFQKMAHGKMVDIQKAYETLMNK